MSKMLKPIDACDKITLIIGLKEIGVDAPSIESFLDELDNQKTVLFTLKSLGYY